MAQAPEFKDFLPGLEFFQTFLKGAGLPSNLANWVAPTLDVGELDRKITDLKAVLSWLEANARVTQSMIQGLEVQRMTLATLQTMNVDMQDFARQFGAAAAQPAPRRSASPTPPKAEAPSAPPVSPAAPESPAGPAEPPAAEEGTEGAEGAATAAAQPLAWWDAITRQFTELATRALTEGQGLAAGFGQSLSGLPRTVGAPVAAAAQAPAKTSTPARKIARTSASKPGGAAATRKRAAPAKRTAAAKTAAGRRSR